MVLIFVYTLTNQKYEKKVTKNLVYSSAYPFVLFYHKVKNYYVMLSIGNLLNFHYNLNTSFSHISIFTSQYKQSCVTLKIKVKEK